MNDKGRVLIIYDHENFLRLVKEQLEGDGYRVVGALTGSEGVKLAGAERFDLVLVDYYLDKHGIQTAADYVPALHKASPGTPVVIISALFPTDMIEPVFGPDGKPLPVITVQPSHEGWVQFRALVSQYARVGFSSKQGNSNRPAAGCE
jgi:CheY-like chemotaxis protein